MKNLWNAELLLLLMPQDRPVLQCWGRFLSLNPVLTMTLQGWTKETAWFSLRVAGSLRKQEYDRCFDKQCLIYMFCRMKWRHWDTWSGGRKSREAPSASGSQIWLCWCHYSRNCKQMCCIKQLKYQRVVHNLLYIKSNLPEGSYSPFISARIELIIMVFFRCNCFWVCYRPIVTIMLVSGRKHSSDCTWNGYMHHWCQLHFKNNKLFCDRYGQKQTTLVFSCFFHSFQGCLRPDYRQLHCNFCLLT